MTVEDAGERGPTVVSGLVFQGLDTDGQNLPNLIRLRTERE